MRYIEQESPDNFFEEISEKYLELFKTGEAPLAPIGVKMIPKGMPLPETTVPLEEYMGTPWCGAIKIASQENEVVVINKNNVGCPAGAIALGLVDKFEETSLEGKRNYTDLMKGKSASPADFSKGFVYACKDTGNMQFSLFGEKDTGRYKTLSAALRAVNGMASIQPAIMKAAVAYTPGNLDLEPDVVILPVKPKQALLIIQGYNYFTGSRIELSTIGIRGVCADLTATPFMEQKLNGSFFCLGARALGGWEGDLVGMGMPFSVFKTVARGMEESSAGFPYAAYPN